MALKRLTSSSTAQLMIHGPLISELDDAVRRGSQEKRVKTLKWITDLFLGAKEKLSEEQIEVFDEEATGDAQNNKPEGGPLEFRERHTSLAAGTCPVQCPCSSCWARKGKAQSSRQAANKAVKKQASVFDSDGYRLVSPNSTMRCAQTLRGTLDCKE
jgi:hypothetical protein